MSLLYEAHIWYFICDFIYSFRMDTALHQTPCSINRLKEILLSNILQLSNFRQTMAYQVQQPELGSFGTVEHLHGTLSRSLRQLRKDMLRDDDCTPEHRFLRSVRPFRQRFCFLVRKFSGLSLEELCSRLNEHPDILKLHRYPSYRHFYPITEQFLTDLETDISKIFEYCSSGMAFGGIGTPTDEVERAIADICKVKKEHKEYIQWCMVYRFGKDMAW